MPPLPHLDRLESRVLLHSFNQGPDGIVRVDTEGTAQSIVVDKISAASIRVSIFDPVGSSSSTLHAAQTFAVATVKGLVIDGRGGDDTIRVNAGVHISVTLRGGSGNDVISSFGDGILEGGDGNDELSGDASHATLDGGAGDDTLFGSAAGPTLYIGGAGIDMANYVPRTERLFLSLDGVANDGAAGEGDNLSDDIEWIQGGSGDDILVGGDGDDHLLGNGGRDRIRGGGGNDGLSGGSLNDILDGGAGADEMVGGAGRDAVDYTSRTTDLSLTSEGLANDGAAGEGDQISPTTENLVGGSGNDFIHGIGLPNHLVGGPGDDTLWGGGGNDLLDGGPGADWLSGHAGNDTLLSIDGQRDTLHGDAGIDVAESDPDDLLNTIP
jgi:Ca2+-binding RTX toxin-like protein